MTESTLPKWFIDEGHKVYKKAEIRTNPFSKVSLKLTPDELTMYEFIKSVEIDRMFCKTDKNFNHFCKAQMWFWDNACNVYSKLLD